MKRIKLGLWVVMASMGMLVACDNETPIMDDDVTSGKKDPITVNTYDNMIAKQNGSFDDDKMMQSLKECVLVQFETYLLDKNNKWVLYGKYEDAYEEMYEQSPIVFFYEDSIRLTMYDHKDRIVEFYPSWKIDYTYDPEINTISTNRTEGGHFYDEITVEDVVREAKVVYYDGEIIIFEGKLFPPAAFNGEKIDGVEKDCDTRVIAHINNELRTKLTDPEQIITTPQDDVDSEAFFNEISSGGNAFYSCRKYQYITGTDQLVKSDGVYYGGTYLGFRVDYETKKAHGYSSAIGGNAEPVRSEGTNDMRIDTDTDTIYWIGTYHEGHEYSAKLIYYKDGIAAFVGNLPSSEMSNDDWKERRYLYVGYVYYDFLSFWDSLTEGE